ncbi:MAG: NAD(P)/FAD-dependent oxidoreductase [Pseudomonadota bacterium]
MADHAEYDVVVVGGGAAGIGAAIALQHAGIRNHLVLERDQVGASFAQWPIETRFLTPSFPTNSIGMLDLNSVAIGVSPGYSMDTEHPTGQHYAMHLRSVAQHFGVPVCEHVEVQRIENDAPGFTVVMRDVSLRARHVIWAAGEFQYPRQDGFHGSDLCQHTASVVSYEDLDGSDFIVIGGYESGVDAAYHLAYHNKRVRLFDRGCPWEETSSDPSVALSPFTLDRMREDWFLERVDLYPSTSITSVARAGDGYEITASDGLRYRTDNSPLWAGGFEGSHRLVADLFETRDDGFPLLNSNDESTLTPGLFLCGPAVRHDNQVFCFIYKYRQRFAVVAKAVATSLGLPAEGLESYRDWGMYLDDLSCCGEECVC